MATFNVANTTELTTALSSAVGGDTILLATGNYGSYTITNTATATPLVIKSADALNPAIFYNITLNGATWITVEDVSLISDNPSTMPLTLGQFEIIGQSSNITIRRAYCKIYDNSSGYQYGRNVTVDPDCTTITVEDCELIGGRQAVVAVRMTGLTLRHNEATDAREGFNFPGCFNVLIENNYLHDFRLHPELGDHADMIQCWAVVGGAPYPAENVQIIDNVLDIGSGSFTQSMFNDLGGGGQPNVYKNWTYARNHIRNCQTHGITTSAHDNLLIEDNIIQWVTPNMSDPFNADEPGLLTDSVHVPKININSTSTNVIIRNNTAYGAPHYSGARFTYPAGATASNNVIYRDLTGPEPNWGGGIDPSPGPLPAVQTSTLTISVTV